MARNNYQVIGDPLTFSSSTPQIIDLYVADVNRLVLAFHVLSGSASSITYSISDGVGVADPTAVSAPIPYVLGGSTYAVMDSNGISYGSDGTNTTIFINLDQVGPWIRVTLSTSSGGNSQVQMYGDI